MNMWGLQPEFLNILEKGFQEFLEKTDAKDLKAEYLCCSPGINGLG